MKAPKGLGSLRAIFDRLARSPLMATYRQLPCPAGVGDGRLGLADEASVDGSHNSSESSAPDTPAFKRGEEARKTSRKVRCCPAQATYGDLRKAHPDLPSQLVISSRMKATQALRSAFALQKKGKKVSAPQWQRGVVRYDARAFASKKSGGRRACHRSRSDQISLYGAPSGPEMARYRADGFATADLLRRPSGWWLHVDVKPPEFGPSGRVVGIDLGINRPAVTSDVRFLGQQNGRKLNNGISGSSANSSPKARSRPSGI
jgi:transposase